jgi:iron complex transport system substrate-binding protein
MVVMRIVSLISAGTEMLFALGLGEQVVAVSHECDWPPECRGLPRASRSNVDSTAASGEIDRQVRSLLTAGELLYEIDRELLASLQPDLIVTQAQCDVCAVPYSDVLQAVERAPQLRDAQVIALNRCSLSDVLNDLLRIGRMTGVTDHAEEVVAGLRGRIDRVRSATSAIPKVDRPRTAIIEWTDPLMLAGNWVPEMVELAGGQCDLTPRGEHSRCVVWDDLLRFDPQVIVVCPCGFDSDRAAAEAEALAHRPGWKQITAVQAGCVFAIDGNAYFNRPGPRLVDSLEVLAELLHPAAHATAPREGVGPSPK